ncbi:MAG TPA: hypothetical protein VMF07_04540 [Solirubrobacteraceae bacterium]|nr:hypothetical protein [Solirubrobacteraceae bacterium]
MPDELFQLPRARDHDDAARARRHRRQCLRRLVDVIEQHQQAPLGAELRE